MVIDDAGSLYWLVRTKDGNVRILRHNPKLEMGSIGFIKNVFEFRSDHVYFFLHFQQRFYLMDAHQRIRVMRFEEQLEELLVETILEIPNKDKSLLEKCPFDNFIITNGVLHWRDRVLFVMSSANLQNNETFNSHQMLSEYLYGPYVVKNSGLAMNITKHEIHLFPLGDLSFIDFLPPYQVERFVYFASFIGNGAILAKYSGRFLLFNSDGTFKQEVEIKFADKKLLLAD